MAERRNIEIKLVDHTGSPFTIYAFPSDFDGLTGADLTDAVESALNQVATKAFRYGKLDERRAMTEFCNREKRNIF